MNLLDGQVRSNKLRKIFGWDKLVPVETLTKQLQASSVLLTRMEAEKDSNIDIAWKSFSLHIPELYEEITKHLSSSSTDSSSVTTMIRNGLAQHSSVWVGDRFIFPRKAAFAAHLDARPYLHTIPASLVGFKLLLTALGVRESFQPLDYTHVLDAVKEKYGTKGLLKEDCDLCIAISQFLYDNSQDIRDTLYLPSNLNILTLAPRMFYNDAPWLRDEKTRNFINEKISHTVADRLGVKSLRQELLRNNAAGLNESLGLSSEAFGQHESLTGRLKNILRLYAEGAGTLFEFIQNADDAKATEVTFLLNMDEYGKSALISPTMKPWQGPALYVYNDAVFGPKDIIAISQIGQGSKMDKVSKTGRFGLGFNSCYHFTDVPSFVSGNSLVIFDPHLKSLPGASSRDPGLLIRFGGKDSMDITKTFPDQFDPYLLFGCNLRDRFEGTMFRFPLRSRRAAKESGIKSEECTAGSILNLFRSFEESASMSLLFLRHISSLKVKVRQNGQIIDLFECGLPDKKQRSLGVWHSCAKTMQSKQAFYQYLATVDEKKLPKGHRILDITTTRFRDYSTQEAAHETGKNLDEKPEKEEKPASTDELKSQIIDTQQMKTPQIHQEKFLVYEMMGGGEARRMAIDVENQRHKLLPWAGVAANISVSRQNKAFTGHAFCFLPLPVTTGLPVHANGYFELSANRRDIWWGSDMTGDGEMRSKWNKSVLRDVLAPAYIELVMEAKTYVTNHSLYYQLWPVNSSSEAWSVALKEFYSRLSTKKALFSEAEGGQWYVPSEAVVLPSVTIEDEQKRYERLFDILLKCDLPMVQLASPKILSHLYDTGKGPKIADREFVRWWLASQVKLSESCNRDDVLFLLGYCTEDLIKSKDFTPMIGLPFIPLANNKFALFKACHRTALHKSEVYVSTTEELSLFPNASNRFVNQNLPSAISDMFWNNIYLSKQTNVKKFTAEVAGHLLAQFFPRQLQNKRSAQWDTKSVDVRWMRQLWNYMLRCSDLKPFAESKCLIIPTVNGKLCALDRDSLAVDISRIPPKMGSFLQKIGCHGVNVDIMGLDEKNLGSLSADHTIWNYVFKGTIQDILAVIKKALSGEKSNRIFDSISHYEKTVLRTYLSAECFKGTQLTVTKDQLSFIKRLPIFEMHTPTTAQGRIFSSLEEKILPPSGVNQQLFTEDFCKVSENESKLLLAIGVKTMQESEFYVKFFFGRLEKLPDNVRFEAVSDILTNLPRLSKETDGKFRSFLQSKAFLENDSGQLCMVSELYDPEVKELKNLLGKKSFPCLKYALSETLVTLRGLGLRSKMDRNGVTQSISAIEELALAADTISDAFKRSVQLLKLLNMRSEELLAESAGDTDEESPDENAPELNVDSKWISTIRNSPWLPATQRAPVVGIPWPESRNKITLCSSGSIRTKKDAWLCSWSKYLLDFDGISPHLEELLGLKAELSAKVLVNQLIQLSHIYTNQNRTADSIHDSLPMQLPLLYTLINDRMKSGGSAASAVKRGLLRTQSWVWIGDSYGFTTPDKVAIECKIDCKPYLFQSPSINASFTELLSSLAVQKTFECVDLSQALEKIARQKAGSTLELQELDFVIRVLKFYVSMKESKESDLDEKKSVLIPNQRGVLTPSKRLMFNDAPWISKNLSSQSALEFVHENVSNELATSLGVKSFRGALLSQKSTEKSIPCSSQSDVKVRIQQLITTAEKVLRKENLKEFDVNGKSIETKSKANENEPTPDQQNSDGDQGELEVVSVEVILDDELEGESSTEKGENKSKTVSKAEKEAEMRDQKAADAKIQMEVGLQAIRDVIETADVAKSRRFEVYFEGREFKSESIFSPMLGGFQGPSLMLNFDVPLSYETILMLQKTFRSGSWGHERVLVQNNLTHYGTGIMSAYAFSDVIMAVTGGNIYILDPLKSTFIDENAKKSAKEPDFKTVSKRATLAATFGKTKKGGFGRLYSFGGTNLCQRFPDQFAPFVKSPFNFSPSGSYDGTIIRLPLRTAPTTLCKFAWNQDNIVALIDALKVSVSSNLLFAQNLEAIQLKSMTSAALLPSLHYQAIVQSNSLSSLRESRRKLLGNIEWHPKTGFMYLFSAWYPKKVSYYMDICSKNAEGIETRDTWLISGTVGSKNARSIALEYHDRVNASGGGIHPALRHALVPIAAVAAHLSTNSQNAPPVDGELFCSYSLPKSNTGLPVHVHAFFALGNSHEVKFIGGQESEWNRELVLETVSESYSELLVEIRNNLRGTSAQNVARISSMAGAKQLLYKFWPISDNMVQGSKNQHFPIIHLMKTLYKTLTTRGLYLTSEEKFSKIKQGFFPVAKTPSSLTRLISPLYPIFIIPPVITKDLLKFASYMKISTLGGAAVRKILRQPKLNALLKTLNSNKIAEILQFVLMDLKDNTYHELQGINLVPLVNGVGTWGLRKYVLASEQQQLLLPLASQYLCFSCIQSPELKKHFLKKSFLQRYLCQFNPKFLAQRMKILFDHNMQRKTFIADWLNSDKEGDVQVSSLMKVSATPANTECKSGHPSLEWIRSFWMEVPGNCTLIYPLS